MNCFSGSGFVRPMPNKKNSKGKYGIGDKLLMQNTDLKVPLIQQLNLALPVANYAGAIGEDERYIYSSYFDGNTYYLFIYNKQTKTYIESRALTGPLIYACSRNGYVYVLAPYDIYNLKISDASFIWDKSLAYSATTSGGGQLKIVNDHLYVVYYSQAGAYCFYENIQLTSDTTYTSITAIQIHSDVNTPIYNLMIPDNNYFYFLGDVWSTVYKFNLQTGVLISNIPVGNLGTYYVDYINNVYYKFDSSNIYCYKLSDRSLLWTYTNTVGTTPTYVIMTDGILLNGSNILLKLSISGNLLYIVRVRLNNSISYNRDLGLLAGTVTDGTNSYLSKIYEALTITG